MVYVNDTIIGSDPTDTVAAIADWVLVGGAGADVVYGGSGSEDIYADMSPGAVSGWAGLDPRHADTIYAGGGRAADGAYHAFRFFKVCRTLSGRGHVPLQSALPDSSHDATPAGCHNALRVLAETSIGSVPVFRLLTYGVN